MGFIRPCLATARSRMSRLWPSSNLTQRTQVSPAHGGTIQPVVSISHEPRPFAPFPLPASLQSCEPRTIHSIRSTSHLLRPIDRDRPIGPAQYLGDGSSAIPSPPHEE